MMASEGGQPYGRRLLPLVLDELAESNPNRLFAAIPKTANVTDGFRDITVADLAHCVNFMAQWIEDRFSRSDNFETISYIGISDLRGPILFQAAVKCGYKLLLPSPRNTPSTNKSLMDQTGCTKILHPSEVAPLVKQLQDLEPSVHTQTIPSFEEMMRSTPEKYNYRKSFYEARDDPIVVLHSSGSTGHPKPVTMTHGSFAAVDNEMNLPSVLGRKKRDSSMWNFDGEARMYMVFPFFHLGGFMFFTVNSIFRNTSPVLGPPHLIPDGPLLKSVMLQQKLRAMFLVPSVIEQLLQEPNGIDLFKDVDFVGYSGAPSSPAVGDRLSKVVELVSPFGSTEIVSVPELSLPREEWAWHEFNPHYRHEMQAYDPTENTFELVIFADESTKDISAIYHNLPGVTEYHTKDLFTRHPEKHQLFKYYGRRDDIIVLANGEKFNPIPFEVNIQSHRSIKGALMIGNGRTQAALLIEPREPLDEVARDKFLEDLWPFIEGSNALVSGQGRLSRGMVICTLPDKPFTRTAKGTIVRKLTEQAYKEELETLYLSSSLPDRTITVELKSSLRRVYEQPAVIDFLRSILATTFVQAAKISEDDDFYSHGLDSVQTLEITSNLKRNLRTQSSKTVTWISPRTIYRNPTLADLSRIVVAFLQDGTVPEEDHQIARARLVDATVAEYVEALPKKSAPQSSVPSKTSTVALIGSTGYLGSHMVLSLLKNTEISRVICLNRGNDAQQRQSVTLRKLDKTIDPLLHKLEYMAIEFGQPLFGLTKDKFDLLAREVDVIVYNSWRLDFGLSIRSFTPFLRVTRDLVDLSASSSRNMRIVFVSSISSVSGMATKTTVPEAPVEDPLAAFNIGYAQSKLAAERILTTANREIGIPVSIVRVCQVGGPTNFEAGSWAEQPWISALLRTAKTMRCCPTNVAPIDWVPVDTVAAMLHDFILYPARKEAQVFNIFPPKPQPWELLVNVMRDTYGVAETISLKEWIKKLRSITDPNADEVAKMPALKILDYYEAIEAGKEHVTFSTDHSMEVSKVNIPTVDKYMMENWVRSWDL
ncbi:acetyl-CoA synthetase-like protein [Biscogniauxia marginata]|nr:acetyl-CoA synthetase-like protein [Biscogniauxia marginata]